MRFFAAFFTFITLLASAATAEAAGLEKFLLRGYIYNAEYNPSTA